MELDELHEIAIAEDGVRDIALDELGIEGIDCKVSVEIPPNIQRVGVMGDARTYGSNAILSLYKDGKVFYEPNIIARISSRITNELPKEPVLVVGVALEFARR